MEKLNFPNAAYGTSETALNYLTKKIHLENADVIALPLDPGFVQTDMGNSGARKLGLEAADITVDESVAGLVDVIDHATREGSSGKLIDFKGNVLEW
ncbi:hypothetical protein LTR53_002308 [Teratosphaeriaceae sp. CCFEE 6253]|nr:hypothetical protein LTR53_002308 [Teratosphaeriaceae sp. CCFEE 6253]